MKRRQLYIDERLWSMLEFRARRDHTTVSETVRRILRETLDSDADQRRNALLAAVGLWKDRTDLPDTESYVRSVRKSPRRWKALQ